MEVSGQLLWRQLRPRWTEAHVRYPVDRINSGWIQRQGREMSRFCRESNHACPFHSLLRYSVRYSDSMVVTISMALMMTNLTVQRRAVSTPDLEPTQPPIQWVLVALSPGVKRPKREADHSPSSSNEFSVEVKIVWSYTSTSPYAGVSKSFQTESKRNQQQQTLIEKQHKRLWRQNSLDWLTK